jgi:trimeric autotransporter adhesin
MTVSRLAASLIISGSIAGCSGKSTGGAQSDAGSQPSNVILKGTVLGGLQGVGDSVIQVYAADSVAGTGATPLLSTTATTDANGSFTLPSISCPAGALIYLVATGGIPGAGAANPSLSMMTALGACGSLAASTTIVVNELTTVAAATALSHFMVSPSSVSGSPDLLAAAFTEAAVLVNPATGTSPGVAVPTGSTVPTTLINTLGDILSSCVDSTGGTAGDLPPTVCGNLFSAVTPSGVNVPPVGKIPPSNTVNAVLEIADNAFLDTAGLYNLLPVSLPFEPHLTAAPASFSIQSASANGVQLSPRNLSFPDTPNGTTQAETQTATLTNDGAAAVSLGTAAIAGSGSFSFSTDCGATLSAGASCTLAFRFAPASAGAQNAVFTAQTSIGDLSINLSGNGT